MRSIIAVVTLLPAVALAHVSDQPPLTHALEHLWLLIPAVVASVLLYRRLFNR